MSKILSVQLSAEIQTTAGLECAETAQPQCMEFIATKQPTAPDTDSVAIADVFGDMKATIIFTDGTVKEVNLIPYMEQDDVTFGKELVSAAAK